MTRDLSRHHRPKAERLIVEAKLASLPGDMRSALFRLAAVLILAGAIQLAITWLHR